MGVRGGTKSRVRTTHTGSPWDPSMAFEGCLCLILGDRRAYHTAGYQDDPVLARRLVLKALEKLRERIDNIVTMDEDLRSAILSRFSELEKTRRGVDWMRLAITLLEVTAQLLGYTYRDGKVHRQVVFFRTKEQELWAFRLRHQNHKQMDRLLREKYTLVRELKGKGFAVPEIAQILGTSEYAIHQVLKDALLERVAKLQADGLATGVEIAKRLGVNPGEVYESLSRLSALSAIKRKARLCEI